MPASGSSSRRSRAIAVLVLLNFSTGGCSPNEVWGVPLDSLLSGLAAGDWETLETVDLQEHPPQDVLRLGADAPYHLALVFAALGRQADAEAMLRLALQDGDPRWHAEAAATLAAALTEAGRYEEAIRVADANLSSDLRVPEAVKLARI